ncbi:hypothetical protein LAZ67_X004723 [Cordylochernes scorpioides]|uniref:Uncharacterized protein n=1 Tax=Cordylochernes scorpioides TaxID=51811 RepID=A0ABY6LZA7_9ARAC|nr:hypothetical protein LAZ67_X004723 [Cordylochernes scorpioides]
MTFLLKWYRKEANDFVLKPFAERYASSDWDKEWKKLLKIFERDPKLLQWYLNSGEPDFESEIKALVTAEAKNCLWLQRRMTHLPPGTLPRGGPCQGGLERSKALLVERLPESQKLMFHCKWHPDGLHLPEHKPYLQEICESIREELW